MKFKALAFALVSVSASGLLLSGCSVFGKIGVATPDYKVLQQDGAFEIREYPQLSLVISQSDGDYKQASRQNFNRLFNYIQGKNAAAEKFSMTAPVLMQPVGQGWEMAFVLPKGVDAPPAASGLKTTTLKNVRFAAYRFNGRLNEQTAREAQMQLSTWLKQKQIAYNDSAVYFGRFITRRGRFLRLKPMKCLVRLDATAP